VASLLVLTLVTSITLDECGGTAGLRVSPVSKAGSIGAIAPQWSEVALPGSVCGATAPIHPHWSSGGLGRAYVRSTYWPRVPEVEVDASRPDLGESLGNGGAELGARYTSDGYINVQCTNGGGMAASRLASAAVVFATGQHEEGELEYPLRVVGVITPQQPKNKGGFPALISSVELVTGRAIVREAWYGPGEGSCCASGRATTIWTYSNGKLVSPRTVIDLAPQTSRTH
jgi:hypothetical protein